MSTWVTRASLIAALVLLVSLTGCSQGSRPKGASATTVATKPVPTSGVSVLPTTTAPPVASTPAPTPPATGGSVGGVRCATATLAVSTSSHGAAAGTAYRVVSFKNTSAGTCTLTGYPGVSFLDAKGQQIGAAAGRTPGTTSPVRLAPGESAAALIAYHDVYVSTFPGCQPATAAAIRVFPPNETVSVNLPATIQVCANPAATGVAEVTPVKPASEVAP